MSGFRYRLYRMMTGVIRPLISLGATVLDAGRRHRTPVTPAPCLLPVVGPASSVVKFRRYRDPAHLNPERVPGGAVILSFPRHRANGVDPSEPRAHAS